MNTLTTKISNADFPQASLKRYQRLRKKMFHPKSDSPLIDKNLSLLKVKYEKIANTLIQNIFRDYLDESVIKIKEIKIKSTFHILFEVNCQKDVYVLKISISEDDTDYSLYIENFMQNLLRKNKLPSIPIRYDVLRKKYPFDFMIMPYVKGKNLDSYEGKSKKKIYQHLGKCFKIIHGLKVEGAGPVSILDLKKNKIKGSYTKWEDFFMVNLEEHIHKVFDIGIIDKEDEKYIRDIFKIHKGLLNSKNLSLLHNDPSPRNIKTDGTKIESILDWEDVIVGDPLWEIAFVNTFNYGEKNQKNFVYFCQGYGINVDKIYSMTIYWIYYLRIVLLKTISKSKEIGYNEVLDRVRIKDVISRLKKLN